MRWGILGTGGVANAFAEALHDVPGAELVAVASRTFDKAFAFADHHEINQPHASYKALVDDPNVDVVYVATPVSGHYEHALMALAAGKHVLVEKSFTANADQTAVLLAEARDRALFCMEAMWCRFLPSYAALRGILLGGDIGEVRAIDARFGGRADIAPQARPFRNDLAGGALLDGAVYPISLAQMVTFDLGDVRAFASIGETGVDEQVAVLMGAPGGVLISCMGGIRTTFDAGATIYGTEGMLVVPTLIDPQWLRVDRPGQEPTVYDTPRTLHRLSYQAVELQACIEAGSTATPLMPPVDTYEVMRVMDEARLQIGLRFPEEVEKV